MKIGIKLHIQDMLSRGYPRSIPSTCDHTSNELFLQLFNQTYMQKTVQFTKYDNLTHSTAVKFTIT